MQLKLEFVLTFESDWHINAGFGADGKADAVIERDPQDKPVISGTTLKGVFRDALYDLALNLGKDTNEVTAILGAPGHDSRWRFSAAVPREKGTRESMVATGVRVDPRYRRAEDNKYFKRELGAAEVFTFSVTGTAADDETDRREVEWLAAAAAYIERLGGRRRRGNGKCIISLVDQNLHAELLKHFENRYCEGTHQITPSWKSLIAEEVSLEIASHHNASHRYRIVLYTERPVIVAEKPEAGNVYQGQIVIPGSALRGAFAELAHPNDLGDARYKRFKELFILGWLKFSHLNPLSENGIPFVQAPLGLQKKEDNPKDFTSVFQYLTEQKGFSGWLPLQNKQSADNVADKKREEKEKKITSTESHPHVRINPDLKRASDGDLYTYEAIPAGRYYAGELYLADNDWQNIGELLRINIDKPFELRIGKGRNRSYGQVKVVIVPMAENDPPAWIHTPLEERLKATPTNELYITLATDTILQDPWGRFYGKFSEPPTDSHNNSDSEPAAQWLTEVFGMQPKEIRIESPDANKQDALNYDKRPAQVVRTKFVESFDARSGLPRWRDKALVAGSTARLVFVNGKRPSNDVLKRLETEGIGLRRSEGYGRVIFNHPAHTEQWSGFAKAIVIPSDLIMSKLKPTPQVRFTDAWNEILKDLRTDNCRYLWTAKYESAAQSIARYLIQTLNQPPEQVLADLNKSFSETAGKDSAQRYQEVAKFAHDQLHAVFTERRNHWRKGVILLAEALMNNREKA